MTTDVIAAQDTWDATVRARETFVPSHPVGMEESAATVNETTPATVQKNSLANLVNFLVITVPPTHVAQEKYAGHMHRELNVFQKNNRSICVHQTPVVTMGTAWTE